MALELKLTTGTYDRVTSILPITDTTGVYAAGTNEGGYGAPNADRNTFSLVLSVRRLSTQSEDAYWETDAVTDAAWNYEFATDGVYELYLVGIPTETSPDVSLLAEDYIYWDTTTSKVYVVSGGTAVETNNVIDGATYISTIQYYLVSSYLETKAINMFCSSFNGGACLGVRDEYNDLNRVIDAIKCNFDETFYSKADELFSLGSKISI
jgi:hypothetical protein